MIGKWDIAALSSATKQSSSCAKVLVRLLKWRRTTAEIVALLAIRCSTSRGICFMIAAARGDRGSEYCVVKQYGMEATGRRTSVGGTKSEILCECFIGSPLGD